MDQVEGRTLWRQLEKLLRRHPTDWTIFWRQLAYAAAAATTGEGASRDQDSLALEGAELLLQVEAAFYDGATLPPELRDAWAAWLQDWIGILRQQVCHPARRPTYLHR
eukprot:SAG11_NODE_1530_length_4737_cov_3.232643_2_plen_108_part_00